jgi:hypothetical protein
VAAGTLKGVVVALLIASVVDRRSGLSKSLAVGASLGLLVSGMAQSRRPMDMILQ